MVLSLPGVQSLLLFCRCCLLPRGLDCLQTVVDEKKNEMENYIPEQFAIVEESKVQTKGNYVWLVISENAKTITDIIENNLS